MGKKKKLVLNLAGWRVGGWGGGIDIKYTITIMITH